MVLPVLCLLLAVVSREAFAQCAGAKDGITCDDGNPTTQGDICFGGICVGFCFAPLVLVNGSCVLTCPVLSIPSMASIVQCADSFVGSSCQFECVLPAIQKSGNATRVCNSTGQWSGAPINCTLPDPCIGNTCAPLSTCVGDTTQSRRYRCDCVADAFGTPGINGTGCIYPTVTTSNGNIVFTVPNTNDIAFNVGTSSFSVLGFDQSIQAIGGSVDIKINTFGKTVHADYTSEISAGVNDLTTSITLLITQSVNAALAEAATLVVSDCNSTAIVADYTSSTQISAARSTALSSAVAFDSSLSTSVSQAISTSKSSQLSTTTAYSTMQGTLSTTYQTQSTLVGSQSSSVSTAIWSVSSTADVQSTLVASQSTTVSNQLSTAGTYSGIWASQSSSVSSSISSLAATSTLTASQSTALSSQVLNLIGRSTIWASQSSAVASASTITAGQIANNEAQITQFASLFTAIKTCAGTASIYDETVSGCVFAALALANFVAGTTCSGSNYGSIRINNGIAIVCNGTSWTTMGRTPNGIVPTTAASNCSYIVAAGDYTIPGPYWIKLSSGSVIQQVCMSTINQGGDGLTAERVTGSCANAFKYFGTSGFLYVDTNLNSTAAFQVLCINGSSYGGDGSTSNKSSTSCSTLSNYWSFTSGMYYINNVSTPCFMRTVYSCQDAFELVPTLTSQVVQIQVRGVIYPTWCQIVAGSAWALVMKMNGTSGNFVYDSALWTTTTLLNATTGVTGGVSDSVEYKSGLYNVFPFTQVRIGLRNGGTSVTTNWVNFQYTGTSLFDVISSGVYGNTTSVLSRAQWFTLSTATGLQQNCNLQGFNVDPTSGSGVRVRIGILGNNENDCLTPESRIGLGGSGASCTVGDVTSVGPQCSCSCFAADTYTSVADGFKSEFGFVLLQ